MNAPIFEFVMNDQAARVHVVDPKIVCLSFAAYGVGISVQFTIAEARAAVDALAKACDQAELLGWTLGDVGGHA